MAQHVGKVKWFDERRGYGFIVVKDMAENVFVHFSAIISDTKGYRTLLPGYEVEFDIITDARGMKASKVKVIGGTVPTKEAANGR